MMNDAVAKIASAHRERIAVIYVRQSTQYQGKRRLQAVLRTVPLAHDDR